MRKQQSLVEACVANFHNGNRADAYSLLIHGTKAEVAVRTLLVLRELEALGHGHHEMIRWIQYHEEERRR